MAANVVSRKDLMTHCKVDTKEYGDQLMILQSAAIAYLKAAGAEKPQLDTYPMAIKGIVLHWFDNPDGGEAFPAGLRAIINQLKMMK